MKRCDCGWIGLDHMEHDCPRKEIFSFKTLSLLTLLFILLPLTIMWLVNR